MLFYFFVYGYTQDLSCTSTDIHQYSAVFNIDEDVPVSERDFSVSDTKRVKFVLGNLQYNYREDRWRIAPHQYDYVGGGFNGHTKFPDTDLWNGEYGTIYVNGVKCWNPKDEATRISSKYNEWIDLFDYVSGNAYSDTVDGVVTRTPTETEFRYLIETRPNANMLRGRARIIIWDENTGSNTFVNGVVILPDDWDLRVFVIGKTFIPDLDGVNGCWFYSDNVLNEEEWKLLEAQGAIFLPAAGTPTGRDNSKYNRSGFYWTSSAGNKSNEGITLEFGGYPYKENSIPTFHSRLKDQKRAFRLCQEILE